MLTILDENDLLTALHDGPFEQPLWSTFLTRLQARVSADYASIIFRPSDRAGYLPVELKVGGRKMPETGQLYRDRFFDSDPFRGAALREGRVYALDEILIAGNAHHDAFRSEVLEPLGQRFMRVVRVTEPGGVSAWLNIAKESEDFTAGDSALLNRVAIHFRKSLRCHMALESQRLRASIAEDVMQRLSFGWISLDAKGCTVEVSPQAQRMLRHDCGLRIARNGRLTATRPAIDRKLTEAMRDIAASPAERPRVLEINRDPWVDMLLAPIAQPDDPTGQRTVMIAYLQGDNQSSAGRHEQIAELFGLLPSEARLALALSRGMSIAEAAESLGLTLETARNYSKKIYAKMGARGQTDLLRFILQSVLALA